jgi:hypothetical protein
MSYERTHNTYRITFYENEDTSSRIDVRIGAFGVIIVPAGSAVIGKTIQVLAVEGDDNVSGSQAMPDTALLSAAKTVSAAGAVSFTSDEIAQIAAAGHIKLQLSASVNADSTIFLLWKS